MARTRDLGTGAADSLFPNSIRDHYLRIKNSLEDEATYLLVRCRVNYHGAMGSGPAPACPVTLAHQPGDLEAASPAAFATGGRRASRSRSLTPRKARRCGARRHPPHGRSAVIPCRASRAGCRCECRLPTQRRGSGSPWPEQPGSTSRTFRPGYQVQVGGIGPASEQQIQRAAVRVRPRSRVKTALIVDRSISNVRNSRGWAERRTRVDDVGLTLQPPWRGRNSRGGTGPEVMKITKQEAQKAIWTYIEKPGGREEIFQRSHQGDAVAL